MKLGSVMLLVLCMGLMAVPAMAQDTAKKDATPKPAGGLSQSVLEQWNDIGRKLIAMAENPPAQEDPQRAKYKTKADVVAFVKKSFEDGAAAIKAKGDAGLAGMMVDPFANRQVRVFDWAYGFMEHSGEHYGQLVVYYRLAGLVPPESRPKK